MDSPNYPLGSTYMIDQRNIVRFRKQNWITMVDIIVWEETVVNLAQGLAGLSTFGLSRYQNRPYILHSQIHPSYLIIFVLHFCSVLSKSSPPKILLKQNSFYNQPTSSVCVSYHFTINIRRRPITKFTNWNSDFVFLLLLSL